MKKLLFGLALSAYFVITPVAYAHPGGTASDGCHYCRTNCSKWGEVEGARHCHNGGSSSGGSRQSKDDDDGGWFWPAAAVTGGAGVVYLLSKDKSK